MQDQTITFSVPGRPRGQDRPRATRAGKGIRMYSPQKDVSYATLIRDAWRKVAPDDWEPWPGLVCLKLWARFARPQSWPKWRREGEYWYPSKPDVSNIVKMVEDALNGIAWVDDAQVQIFHATKHLGKTGGLKVQLEFEHDARMIHKAAMQEM